MAYLRLKKLTDSSYSPTNPASESAIRSQVDGAIQEAYDMVESSTEGASGSDYIGSSKLYPTDPSGTRLINKLKHIYALIQGLVVGQVPDNSITNDKLVSDAKIGSLASLSALLTGFTSSITVAINKIVDWIGDLTTLGTTDKSSLVNAINEVRTENRTAPTETVITTGFPSSFSGTIKIKKTLEGLKIIDCTIVKTTDIALADTAFTLDVDYRPLTTDAKFFCQGLASNGSTIAGATIAGFIESSTGNMKLIPAGTVTTNVRQFRFTMAYS